MIKDILAWVKRDWDRMPMSPSKLLGIRSDAMVLKAFHPDDSDAIDNWVREEFKMSETNTMTHIKGYTPQSENQVAAINYYKELEAKLIDDVQMLLDGQATFEPTGTTPLEVDKRWASIGKTHFQEGFMALVRSIAKPTGN